MNVNAFTPGATATLSVSTSTARVAISGIGNSVELQNDTTTTIFVKFGDSTVTAATTDYPVLAGQSKMVTRDPVAHTYIAAITGTGSGTFYATVGEGA